MKVYMIGIGGASMRGLCEILIEKGMNVCGSDQNGCESLEAMGVVVFKTHKKENIPHGTQIVVYSSAVAMGNEELQYARENHICTFSRGELLGLISRGFEKVVAISGSHGKTTTTAMIAEIFAFAGKNATVHMGVDGGKKKCGNGGDIFLCEACEYCDNFLFLAPTLGVVLNMEYDHPDFFKSRQHHASSFARFARQSKVFLCGKKTANRLGISRKITCEIQKNNGENACEFADFSASNLRETEGYFTFDFFAKQQFICEITLRILGKFNVENALFACAVATLFGATPFELQKGIGGFFGVRRRLEKIAKKDGAEIFCDYAHHPTQIAKIVETFPKSTLYIFQPHTYSRTKALLSEFISALEPIENLIITKTYPAREKFDFEGSGEFLASKLPNAIFMEKENIISYIKTLSPQKIIFLGAGDIEGVGRELGCVGEFG